MAAIVIIPARFDSTRFPGKPLCILKGKPLIQHVYEGVQGSKGVKDIFVATDSKEIYERVAGFGGKAVMTSRSHQSGTDRIGEAVSRLQGDGYNIDAGDIIINVQGDEPMVRPEMVEGLIKLMGDKRAAIGTLAKRISDDMEITNPNVVKVVFNEDGFALYFSRAPIPYHRECAYNMYFKHIGIYSYRRDVLTAFSKMSPTRLEQIEKLEQLRALERGCMIKVGITEVETIGVDTPQDMERVERCLSISS
ncbi:MAG: 3-deoxy-manno-octulosonate cytidylyltransferase [Nitrospirae bacterium]|nr:3-deoxy-manno-octulosonate cytidylyltransferase [Nitrospirota bacterium]